MQQETKRRWFLLYPVVFASFLSFYRRFESQENYPVAYASAGITVILSTLLIATAFFVSRRDFHLGVDLSWSTSFSVGLAVSIVFYFCHIYFVSKSDYWRKLLVDFDSERPAFKILANLSTITLFGGAMSWLFFELYWA